MDTGMEIESPFTYSTWYKCPDCHILLSNAITFLDHYQAHFSNNVNPMFQTITGKLVGIKELPKTYDMFIPNIQLQSFENVCRRSKITVQLPIINAPKLTDSEIKLATGQLTSSGRPKRAKRNRAKYDILEAGDEDDFVLPGEDHDEELVSIEEDDDDEFVAPSSVSKSNGSTCKRVRPKGTKVRDRKNRNRKPRKPVEGKEARFSCRYCDKKYYWKAQLVHHEGIHEKRKKINDVKPFKCTICGEGYSQRWNFRQHFLMHTEDNPFLCKFPGCGHRASRRDHFQRHLQRHFAENVFCPICNREYGQKRSLLEHMAKIHPDGKSTVLPKNKLKTTGPINRVRRLIVPDDIPEAGDILKLQSRLALARAQLEPESGSDVRRVDLESVHLGDPDDIKQESAEALAAVKEELEFSMANPGIKQEEKMTHEPDQVPDYSQPKANAELPSPTRRTPVKRPRPSLPKRGKFGPGQSERETPYDVYNSYTSYDDFPCKVCVFPAVSYNRVHFLQQHMLKVHPEVVEKQVSASISSTEVSLFCGRCGFQSTSAKGLKTHMKTHSNSRTFKCPKVPCNMATTSQARLDAHIRNFHSNAERKFKCETCPKAFVREATLRKHTDTVHPEELTDPSKLKCKTCGKQVKNRTALDAHRKFVHAKSLQPSICQICNQTLSCAASLTRHIRLVHINIGKDLERKDQDQEGNADSENNIFL